MQQMNQTIYNKLVRNQDDIFYCINKPARKIGTKVIDAIKELKKDNHDYFNIIESLNDTHPALKPFVEDIKYFRTIDNLELMVKSIIEKYNLLVYFKEDDRKANINEFLNIVKKYNSLHEFLVNLVLSSDDMDNSNGIKLMTVHGSKGLEFSHVFVIGLEEDIFPSYFSKNDNDLLEEERRLMYVCITRAKHKLYLSHCLTRFKWGKHINVKISRFISEIGYEHLDGTKIYNAQENKNMNMLDNSSKCISVDDDYDSAQAGYFENIPSKKSYGGSSNISFACLDSSILNDEKWLNFVDSTVIDGRTYEPFTLLENGLTAEDFL